MLSQKVEQETIAEKEYMCFLFSEEVSQSNIVGLPKNGMETNCYTVCSIICTFCNEFCHYLSHNRFKGFHICWFKIKTIWQENAVMSVPKALLQSIDNLLNCLLQSLLSDCTVGGDSWTWRNTMKTFLPPQALRRDVHRGAVPLMSVHSWTTHQQMLSSTGSGLWDLGLFRPDWRCAAPPVTTRSGAVSNPLPCPVLPWLSSHYHFGSWILPLCPHY